MSTFYASKGLKFLWKIENFSLLKGEGFFSPLIEPQKEEWVISITRNNSNISARLLNWNYTSYGPICCSLSFLNNDGTPLICKGGERDYGNDKFNFLFPNETKYFPDNTLRAEFRMWMVGQECGLFSPISCFVCTQMVPIVKVIKKSYRCFFLKVGSFKESLSVTFSKRIYSGWDLDICINLLQDGDVSVEFKSTLFGFHAKIKVYLEDASGKAIEFGNHSAKFTSENPSCKFDLNISKAILLCHSEKFLPSGTLSLVFACKFTGCFYFNRIVYEREIFENGPQVNAIATADSNEQEDDTSQLNKTPEPNTQVQESRRTVSQYFLDMLREGYLSDFNLKVGERTFSVHKAILGMRSKVFKAMFDSEMKEMQDNCMDIKDVDGVTLQRMLEFVYSDRIDNDMDLTDASSLYAVADFYALESLKQGCSTILKDGLSITSAMGVLALADLHQDQELKSAALDFILLYDQVIIGTEAWNKFEEENSKLAMEIFRELYMKKMRI